MTPDGTIPVMSDVIGPPLVSPGVYTGVYIGHKAGIVFRTPKLRLDLRLLEHPDIVLERWYRIVDFRGNRIRAGRHSDLVREISAVIGRRVRCDRIPVASLVNLQLRFEVATITKDSNQRPLARVNQYSAVARLLERLV